MAKMIIKRIINKFRFHANRFILSIKSIKKVYKYGGYTPVNITKINYGEILQGKKILITGGSSGIGLSIAKKCISGGAMVVITGRNAEKLKETDKQINNSRLKTLIWDISDITQTDEHIVKTEKLLEGTIDVLVNNAGVLLGGQNFPYVKEKVWDITYAINSKGLFFLTQSIVKKWLDNKTNRGKKIINISSQGGFVGALYPYRMSKWDVAGFTQGLGIKLAPLGIIVNGIAPGIIATGMQPDTIKREENMFYPHIPIERFALPDEIAELAHFLISDASNFIVGQTIICDGGFSIK